MNITAIEIKNIKGIEYKKFEVNLIANKPNLLVASNGFGKSSIATAFASMNSQRMNLADKDHYMENTSLNPELSIEFNGQMLTADNSRNEIRPQFDVTVIRSGLVPKATKHNMGRFTQASASLEVESITINKIPPKIAINYGVTNIRRKFGSNGKILPNISDLLQNPILSVAIQGWDLNKYTGVRVQKDISSLINRINHQTGTSDQISQWISDNLLNNFRTIAPLRDIANNLLQLNLVSAETVAFLTAYQIAEIIRTDSKSFKAAIDWFQYILERDSYRDLIQSFCSSAWQWAKLSENNNTLSVVFPQAHQLSNGQRDVLTLVVQMHKALYEGSKKPLILVIDEVFDYLDDANLVAFQYYVTCLIQEYKQKTQPVYPIILTHLDPGIFFDFCFNTHKIHTHYLQARPIGKSGDILKLIKARDFDGTSESIRDKLDLYWFHFNADSFEIPSDDWPINTKIEWRKSKDFHDYTITELDRYLDGNNYDTLAICIAVRVLIENNVYNLLATEEQKQKLLSTHKTKEKLNFAATQIPDISESFFLLGLIHNSNLHWKQGKDYVTPLICKLNHPVIKSLIRNLRTSTEVE